MRENERGTFTNDLYVLQYVRRTFGSTGGADAVKHPKRVRGMLLEELVPCIEPERELDDKDYHSDDDESVFSYKTKRVDLHAGVGGTAHLTFTFPHGNPESGDPERVHQIIPNLPNLVNQVAAENSYTLTGESLEEIFQRQNKARVDAGLKPRDHTVIRF